MAENFDLIFGQNASQQYAWSDNDYQKGWETIGNIPPTAAQFDALQRRSDTKLKELNDELTPLVNADTADSRQPSTTYSEGDIKYSSLLPTGWFLTCTTAGTTSASELVLPTPIAEKDTVTDGTVTWTIKKMGTGSGGDGVPLGAILPLAHNSTLPAGYLLCDGSAVSRTMYPDLFSVIGTTYGAGDGSTTFNLPNLSDNRFVEGSTTAGTTHAAGLPNIKSGSSGVNFAWGNSTGIPSTTQIPPFTTTAHGMVAVTIGAGAWREAYLKFDASLSNPIYSDSVTTVQPPALTARYIIKAFDGQTADSALIDITQYANELATKANRQLSNLDTANLACHVVVDSYYDSTTGDWWRKYDDGWIEQGGIIQSNASPTITFLQPYNDTKYIVVANYFDTNAPGNASLYDLSTYPNRTATTVQIGRAMSYKKQWYSCGMGANN